MPKSRCTPTPQTMWPTPTTPSAARTMPAPTSSYERSFEMLKRNTLSRSAMMLGLLCAMCLASCGKERPRLVLPPANRFAQVPIPTPPAGNSDAEVAGFIASYDAALKQANRQLGWAYDWVVTAGK